MIIMSRLLFEDTEEKKYPRWFRYIAIIYGIVFLWTLFSLPPTGYDFDSLTLVALLWLPAIIGLLYILDKPSFIEARRKAMRILFTVFAFIAIFWGLALSYAFME